MEGIRFSYSVKNMDLKQLQYFATVVEEGNITTAAKKLHMSQPPLSTQIKLLEEEFGCLLFERGARKIMLTDAGRMLYNHALKLLELSRVTKEEVINCSSAAGGTIRIGVASSVIYSFSSKWMGGFIRNNPRVTFEIYEADTYGLLEKLKSNVIHIAIIRTPFTGNEFTCEMLFDEGIFAIGNRVLFDDPGKTVSFEELSNKPLILYRRWEEIIRKEFKERSLELHCFCINDDARTTVYFADQSFGIAIVPESGRDFINNPDTVIKKIYPCDISSKVELVYDSNAYMPECSKNFIQYLKSNI